VTLENPVKCKKFLETSKWREHWAKIAPADALNLAALTAPIIEAFKAAVQADKENEGQSPIPWEFEIDPTKRNLFNPGVEVDNPLSPTSMDDELDKWFPRLDR